MEINWPSFDLVLTAQKIDAENPLSVTLDDWNHLVTDLPTDQRKFPPKQVTQSFGTIE